MSQTEDILEEEEEEGEEWVLSVARGVGTVVASVSGAFRKVSSGAPLVARRPVPRKRRGRDLKVVLRDLGEVVSTHARDDWESLEHDPEFWRLIALLRRSPRRPRPRRRDDVSCSSAQDVIDAQVTRESTNE